MIGFFQAISIIPGVSRSGIVITACRYSNFNRVDAAKISFLLSIPALAGASVLGFNDIQYKSFEFNLAIYLSVLFSFIFSYMTIKFLLYYPGSTQKVLCELNRHSGMKKLTAL